MDCRAAAKRAVVLVTAVVLVLVVPPAGAIARTSALRHPAHRAHTSRRRRHHRRRHRHPARRRSQAGTAQSPAPLPPDACPNSGISARTAPVDAMRSAVVCEINLQRAARGLPALAEAGALDSSAQGWSQAMVASHQLSHGVSFTARISAAGYPWGSAGENIASGYLTPRAVVAAWMTSPDHCRNILTPTFRDVGIGEVPAAAAAGGPATWTADFGLRLLESPPSGNWGPADACPY